VPHNESILETGSLDLDFFSARFVLSCTPESAPSTDVEVDAVVGGEPTQDQLFGPHLPADLCALALPCVGTRHVTDAQSLSALSLCSSLAGSLRLDGGPDHTTFISPGDTSLSCLQRIDGRLTVEFDSAESELPMPALISVGGLHYSQNERPTTFSGLKNLRRVRGDLEIVRNDLLVTFNGLRRVKEVEGHLYISQNYKLDEIKGPKYLTDVGGDVDIYHGTLSAFHGMSSLKTIAGNLRVTDTETVVMSWFSGLEDVGTIRIHDNPLMTSITGLSSLASTRDDLQIKQNDDLLDLSGLSQLQEVGQDLSLSHNPSLSDLTGFSSLEEVQRNVWLSNMNGLTSLAGWEHLREARRELGIRECRNLETADLPALTRLGTLELHTNESLTGIDLPGVEDLDDLMVKDNESLQSLEGLENVVDANLVALISNKELTSLEGLSSLTSLRTLRIKDNPSLCQQAAEDFAAGFDLYNEPKIENNGPCP
jgi:hypothetical protein